jgi:hypothetical protein
VYTCAHTYIPHTYGCAFGRNKKQEKKKKKIDEMKRKNGGGRKKNLSIGLPVWSSLEGKYFYEDCAISNNIAAI